MSKLLSSLKLMVRDRRFWVGAFIVVAIAEFALAWRPTGNPDIRGFLIPWMEQIRADWTGIFYYETANYNPPYYYLMTLISRLPGSFLGWIGTFSVAFSVAGAWLIGKLAMRLTGKGELMLWRVATLTLLLPTVWYNSAHWHQCDSLYTFFILLALYYGVEKRWGLSMIWFGVSISLKLQAVFLAPMGIMLLMDRQLPWKSLLWIPLVYVVSFLPAILLAHLPVDYLFHFYDLQVGECKSGIFSNWAILVSEPDYERYAMPLKVIPVVVLLMLSVFMGLRTKTIAGGNLIIAAYFSIILSTTVLPSMHDRYMFVADMLLVLWCVLSDRRKWWVVITMLCISMLHYFSWHVGLRYRAEIVYVNAMRLAAVIQLIVTIYLARDLILRTGKETAKDRIVRAPNRVAD